MYAIKPTAALLGVCLAAPAFADVPERHTGLYASLSGGVHSPSYVEAEGTGLDRIHFRRGPEINGAVGWAFENGLRLEFEGSYIRTGFKCFTLHASNGGCRDVGGSTDTYRAMLGVAYDYGHQRGWIVQPFVGARLGATVADVYLGTPMSVNGERREKWERNGRGRTNVKPTWAVEIGVNLPLTERLTAFSSVRYTATIGTADIRGGEDGPGYTGGSSWELEGPSALLGLRVGF